MKLLMTGATGYVGQHALARLNRCDGIDLSILCRTPSAAPLGVVPVIGRIGQEPLDWDALGRPDVVLHLAWGGLPNYRSPHHFEEAHWHSVFLRRLMHQGLPRLVCVGTCFEYGMRDGCLVEDRPGQPSNPYGLAKDLLRCQLVMDGADTSLLWARFFYLYGPGQAVGSLYSQVQAAIARCDPAFKMSGGEQLRDFLPIDTAVDYLIRLALDPRAEGLVNIASGTPVSVRRLVERWFAEAGREVSLDLGYYPYPDWEPFAFWGSAAKLHMMLAR